MKLQDLLPVLKDNPEINIYYLSRGSSIFRGPLTQLPYVRVEQLLQTEVANIIDTEEYLRITLKI